MAGARILAIEDDEVIRRLLSVLLEDAGHEVSLAEAGDVGLAMARELRPDLVLVDIGLPNLHGNEVLEEIKRDPEIGGTPVIIVSAWGDAIAARSRELGAYDVLMKPFTDESLIATVSEALVGRPPAVTVDAPGDPLARPEAVERRDPGPSSGPPGAA
jgi:two-component system KDP operon response regulator KdpE